MHAPSPTPLPQGEGEFFRAAPPYPDAHEGPPRGGAVGHEVDRTGQSTLVGCEDYPTGFHRHLASSRLPGLALGPGIPDG